MQGECQGAFRAESPDDPPFLLLAPLLRRERCKPDGYSDPPAVCRDWMGMPATAPRKPLHEADDVLGDEHRLFLHREVPCTGGYGIPDSFPADAIERR